MVRTAKSKPSIQLGRWNIVVLTVAGFWVLIFIVFFWGLTSELIAHFRFGGPAQIAAGAKAVQIPRAHAIGSGDFSLVALTVMAGFFAATSMP
jgi:hypothetical protein